MGHLKDLVLKWNDTWKYDYWFRKKYNIRFNSKEHREVSQIDVKFNFIEHVLANNEEAISSIRNKQLAIYEKTGSWLRDRKMSKEAEDALFDLIDINNLGNGETN